MKRMLRLVAIAIVCALLGLLVLPPLLPRPRYTYVMDYHYRRFAAAMIGLVAGIAIEAVLRWHAGRASK
jgi:hypothetical protein